MRKTWEISGFSSSQPENSPLVVVSAVYQIEMHANIKVQQSHARSKWNLDLARPGEARIISRRAKGERSELVRPSSHLSVNGHPHLPEAVKKCSEEQERFFPMKRIGTKAAKRLPAPGRRKANKRLLLCEP
jgi:hypothetical protein